MAKELALRLNIAHRSVTVDVQDIFGNITHHTVPLFGDPCPTCQMAVAGGTTDLKASTAAIVQAVTDIETALLGKLKAAGIDFPQV